MKGDERILGQGDIRRTVLKAAQESLDRKSDDPGSWVRLRLVVGSSARFIRSYFQGVIDGLKATKNGTGSECVVLLGNARTGDERSRNIEKTEHRLLDGKRIRDEGPANRRIARVKAFGLGALNNPRIRGMSLNISPMQDFPLLPTAFGGAYLEL